MIKETSKKVLYAAVGAPVMAARKVGERVTDMTSKAHDLRDKLTEDLAKELDEWAAEGQKLVEKIKEREAVEELVDDLTSALDLDQIQEQVGKLREQLDDMLQSWRSSFKPETGKLEKVEVVEEKPAPKPAAKKTTTTKSTAAKKPAAKKTTTTKSTAAKKPAAKKTTTTKSTTAKKPAAKSTTEKTKASA